MQTKTFPTAPESACNVQDDTIKLKSKRRVSIIVVNWNGREHLPDCLGSLEQQTYTDFEIIVVDNGSADGSVEFIQKNYPTVHIVRLPENRGFAAGNNAGLTHATGEFIITLNNDTCADTGWLAELVSVADSCPEAGMVASRICNFYNRDTIDSLGMKICRDGMSRGAHRLQSFSALSLERISAILFPSACVALYRRAMIDQIGFFDEDFFAYCEDTDLGLRGRLAGWGAVLARDAIVWHKYSQTAGTFSPFKLYLVERNHYWMAFKTFPLLWLLLLPFFTAVRFAVQAVAVFSGRGAGGEFLDSGSRKECLHAVFKGIRDAIAAVPTLLHKRSAVMRMRTLTDGECTRLLKSNSLSFKDLLDSGE
jgi:GT2 family glycosyltransferase